MGAASFDSYGYGVSLNDAFRDAVTRAQHEHGHGGYSGTIAEKREVVEFVLPPRITSTRFIGVAWEALSESWGPVADTPKGTRGISTPCQDQLTRWLGAVKASELLRVIDDKWGPAAAIKLGEAETNKILPAYISRKRRGYRLYRFFGYASY